MEYILFQRLIQTFKNFIWISATAIEQADLTSNFGTVDKCIKKPPSPNPLIYGYRLGEVSNITQIRMI